MPDYIDHPLIQKQTIQSRLYQQFLFAEAVKENSLIILPTGLGKTIIMVMIAARFLQKEPRKKVVVVAPTRPLVDQHLDTFQQCLNIPKDKIIVVSGGTPPKKRDELWQNGGLILCTPQTLRNDIVSGICNLREISLLCLDEVHRAVGDGPYVLPAQQYLKKNDHAHLLGFTASPGSKEKLLEIIKNTNLTNIQYMDENHQLVKPYIFGSSEEFVRVNLPLEMKSSLSILKKVTKNYLTILKDLEIIQSSQITNNPKRKLIQLPTQINAKRESLGETNFFTVMSSYGQLMLITQAIEMLETQGIVTAQKYFEAKEDEFRNSNKGSLKRFLHHPEINQVYQSLKKLSKSNFEHPKLTKLKTLVNNEITNNHDTRILVFANYKATIDHLVKELHKIDGVKAHRFVGQATTSYGKGLSQKDQISILKGFKGKQYNVLVSTSVGEEGLDVAQCDLVVFYDVTPSSTRLIQRSGRTGRGRKGRVIILIASRTRDDGYYFASQKQRKRLSQIVEEVKSILKKVDILSDQSLDKYFSNDFSSTIAHQKDDNNNNLNIHSGISTNHNSENLKDFFNIQNMNTKDRDNINFDKQVDEVRVYIDHREKGSAILNSLMDHNIDLKQIILPTADFVISDRIGIERKTITDFCQTLLRNDLFEQLKILKDTYHKPIIILEGENLNSCSLSKNAVLGAISSIMIDFNIPIIRTSNPQDSVDIVVALAKREQLKHKRKPRIRKSINSGNLSDEQLFLISSLPNIDRILAERLLNKFKNPRNIISAHPDELRKVKGIGPQKADRIDILLSSPFEEDNESDEN